MSFPGPEKVTKTDFIVSLLLFPFLLSEFEGVNEDWSGQSLGSDWSCDNVLKSPVYLCRHETYLFDHPSLLL